MLDSLAKWMCFVVDEKNDDARLSDHNSLGQHVSDDDMNDEDDYVNSVQLQPPNLWISHSQD